MISKLRKIDEFKTNTIIFLLGIVCICVGIIFKNDIGDIGTTIILSVGASIIASAIISYITSTYLFKQQKARELYEVWGLESISDTRAEMNKKINQNLIKANKQLDVIAYGLKSLRDSVNTIIEEKIKNGFNVRILTVNPNSPLLSQKDLDEDRKNGSTAYEIKQLQKWANDIGIEIHFIDKLPTELYFRLDDHMYIGPYEIGIESQRTITYEFSSGSKGFNYYTNYFERLWELSNK